MPQSYTSYINAIEDDNWRACDRHRKKFNVSFEQMEETDCENLPCNEGCPFSK